MADCSHPPPAIWAQRQDKVYLTINVEDCANPTIKLEKDKLYFRGKGGIGDAKEFESTIEFFGEVIPEESKYAVMPRHIPFMVKKAEDGYWPRLLKTKTKVHWLKTDFDKWRDEDDSDGDEAQDAQFEDMMRQMGNTNLGGGPMDDDEEVDSDDEDLPDLEENDKKDEDEDDKKMEGDSN